MEDPMILRARKTEAMALEDRYSKGGRRQVNLDPGYLNSHQVVLSTFKNFAHRIWLGGGVYAHLEYIFLKDGLSELPWTYPDFRSTEYKALFKRWRELYKRMKEEIPISNF
jgi:hypothetical protein